MVKSLRSHPGAGAESGRVMTIHELDSGLASWPLKTTAADNSLRRHAARLPRVFRFLGVGTIGLMTDVGVFTAINAFVNMPLFARLVSLAIGTLVTWRLNRALTFDASGRSQHDEAARYVIVTLAAQGLSYAIFAALVLSALHWFPQAALLTGAAIAAAFSYSGHRWFVFKPRKTHLSGR